MSMIDRSIDGMAFLTGQLGAALKRRLREAGRRGADQPRHDGALALATWSVQDPSLSHATDAAGPQSARPARRDRAPICMMQISASARWCCMLPIAVWGYRLLGHRPLEPRAAAGRAAGSSARCFRPRSRRACRARRIGRCRPGSAASSATPSCACRQSLFGRAAAVQPPFGRRDRVRRAPASRFAGASGLVWHDDADAGRDDDETAMRPNEDDGRRRLDLARLHRARLLSLRARLALTVPPAAAARARWRRQSACRAGASNRARRRAAAPAERPFEPADAEAGRRG